ncbi:hypothetical protein CBS101457_005965 [Exobasidium rhododendri]|nr:hypothetical protein CBS101457_005965 [Exobasidium rhododendri]
MALNRARYVLHYWPGLPGRGEFIRLAFESTSHPYTEKNKPMEIVMKAGDSVVGHPPHFACPVLEIGDESSPSPSIFISQTAAILAYLAPILQLDGGASSLDSAAHAQIRRAQVNQITLTILDLHNEVHDVHHPISISEVYEEQKEEALRRSKDFRKNRIPKFFRLFQQTLESNPDSQKGWLISNNFSTADLTLFQVVEGLHFAFPRLMAALNASKKYDLVFELRRRVAAIDSVNAYLQSSRRLPFSNGIFRHYPELDGEE